MNSSDWHQFVLESDFHGFRHCMDRRLSPLRRALWILILLSSLVVLGYIVGTRVQYYFTYPTSISYTTEYNVMPVPGISICPAYLHSILSTPSSLFHLSDGEFAFILSHMDVPILIENNTNEQRGIFVLNSELLNEADSFLFPGNDTSSKLRYLIALAPEIPEYIQENGLTTAALSRFVQRMQAMSRNLSVNINVEYPRFVSKFGVSTSQIKRCSIWIRSPSDEPIDCMPDFRHVLTPEGACLVLDNVRGTRIQFRDHKKQTLDNEINIEFERNDNEIFLYNADELPGQDVYGSVQYRFRPGQKMAIAKVILHQTLSTPYSKTPCAPRSYCIRDCIMNNSECQPFFLHVDEKKPICWPPDQLDPQLQDQCDNICIRSCNTIEFVSAHKKEVPNFFSIAVHEYAIYEITEQVPLYSLTSLLAELGGTLGLFIGASVLTLYHCIECTMVTVLLSFMKYILPKRDQKKNISALTCK